MPTDVLELIAGPLLKTIASLSCEKIVPGGPDHPRLVQKKRVNVRSYYFPDARGRTLPWKKALSCGHRHDRLEICTPLSGRPLIALDQKIYRLSPSDLAVIAPQALHFESFDNPRSPFRLLWVSMSRDTAAIVVIAYSPRAGYSGRGQAAIGTYESEFGDLEDLARRADWGRDSIKALRLSLLAIAHKAAHFISTGEPAATDDAPRSVQRAQEFILNHYRESLSITDVARYAGLSPNYLSLLYRKHVGRTVLEEVHALRLSEAKSRLSTTTDSLKQIAYGLGFTKPQSFTRFFRKMTGRTPIAYRKAPDRRNG